MNCEQRYNEALERARKEYKTHESFNGFREMLLRIFPELEESDDNERIRKKLLKMFNDMERDESILDDYGLDKLKTIAWLEKQGEQKPTQETESFEAEHGKYYYCIKDYFCGGRKQASKGDVIQALRGLPIMGLKDVSEYFLPINLIKSYRAWSEEDEKIVDMLNDYVKNLDIFFSEIKIGDKDILSKEFREKVQHWLKSIKDRIQLNQSNKPQGKTALEANKEENVDNANKVEPKFKVGDWVVRKDGGVFFNDRKFAQITEIDGEKHWFDTGLISLKAEDMRLWRLEDAKDGDILYSKKHNLLWRYKNTKECYFCMNLNYNSNNISKGDAIVIPNDVKPATKEQRDLLLDKILQQGQHNPIENANIENANNDISNDMSNDMPNLKVGDWVIREDGKPFRNGNKFAQIKSIKFDGNMCFLDTGRWLYSSEIRAWSIYDAKPGDVLVASDGSIFIFAGVVDYACKYYVALTLYNGLSINKEVKGGYWEISRAVHPATKEQCDLLFAKMREKGYKYNNEKKEIIRRI